MVVVLDNKYRTKTRLNRFFFFFCLILEHKLITEPWPQSGLAAVISGMDDLFASCGLLAVRMSDGPLLADNLDRILRVVLQLCIGSLCFPAMLCNCQVWIFYQNKSCIKVCSHLI